MQTFLFSLPTRIAFGPGAIENVGHETALFGRRALLVTGSTFARRSGLIDSIQQRLAEAGVRVTIFDGINRNATVEAIDEGGRVAREGEVDLVLGLGGGSALDAAKGIAVTAAMGGSIWRYARFSPEHDPARFDALPIVQVPIIASTGTETNDRAVVLNEACRVRAPVSGPELYARAAIVDPTVTFTVPARYTAVGAMNTVSQMLESYLTSDEFAATDRVTEGLMRAVMDSLPRALRRSEDLDARNNLSWASALAPSVALAGRGGLSPLGAIAQAVTAYFDVDHGATLAALWPSYMRFALANHFRFPQIGRFKRYALLGRQIFGVHETDDEMAAEMMSHRFASWLRSMDMPADLSALGIEDPPMAELAEQAVTVSGNGRRLPGGLTAHDLEHIIQGAIPSA